MKPTMAHELGVGRGDAEPGVWGVGIARARAWFVYRTVPRIPANGHTGHEYAEDKRGRIRHFGSSVSAARLAITLNKAVLK